MSSRAAPGFTPAQKSELAALCRAHVEREIARAPIPSPGPWTARPDGSVVDASGEVVAIVMRHADLATIAAAPELLAALRRIADDGVERSRDPRTVIAREALARAECRR